MIKINLPNDPQLEIYALSAIMMSINAADMANSDLDDSDFFDSKNKLLFKIIKKIYHKNTPVSEHEIHMYLKNNNLLQELSLDYLLMVSLSYWSGMPFDDFFCKLKNLSSLRKSIYAGQELIIQAANNEADISKVMNEHQKRLLEAQGFSFKEGRSVEEMIKDFIDKRSFIQDVDWRRERFSNGLPTYHGVSTGYPLLDETLGCLQNSCIYYVGARTSMGKTTFMLNLIRNMLGKKKIGIFSLEMPAPIILAKLICMKADIRYSNYSQGNFTEEYAERFKVIAPHFEKYSLVIEDEDSINIGKLASRAKRMIQNHGIEILFIDYLTRIQSNTKYSSKHLQVDEVSKGLQSLAKTLKIPVVCLAQLNRQVTGRSDNRPSLADFRESGSIEEDADACILLHRPEYYKPNEKPGMVEVHVAKNRIMGTLKKLDFSCNSRASEVYHEAKEISEAVREANEREEEERFDKILMRI